MIHMVIAHVVGSEKKFLALYWSHMTAGWKEYSVSALSRRKQKATIGWKGFQGLIGPLCLLRLFWYANWATLDGSQWNSGTIGHVMWCDGKGHLHWTIGQLARAYRFEWLDMEIASSLSNKPSELQKEQSMTPPKKNLNWDDCICQDPERTWLRSKSKCNPEFNIKLPSSCVGLGKYCKDSALSLSFL